MNGVWETEEVFVSKCSARRCLVMVCGMMAAGWSAAQQIEVGMTLAYSVFLTGEPVLVQFDVLNATRNVIDVGGKDSPDTVLVELSLGGQNNPVACVNATPVAGRFRLNPGQAMQHRVELDKWFPVLHEGKYFARLVVVHAGMRYESAKKSFDVVPGIPLHEGVQMFVGQQNLKRVFRLVYWHRNQSDRLFLRIEDDPGAKVWDTMDLGDVMRMMPPKLDISPEGEVTVVHRASQDAFLRTMLWSLPDAVEVVERNALLDPEISATQRVKSLYGEMADEGEKKENKPWWKLW